MTDILDTILSQEDAARCFAALGSEQRLSVLQALVAAGPSGLNAQVRDGRQIISRADFDRVEQVSRYLLLNCCAEAAESHSHHGAAR